MANKIDSDWETISSQDNEWETISSQPSQAEIPFTPLEKTADFLRPFNEAINTTMSRPEYSLSPQGNLNTAYGMVQTPFEKGGEMLTEKMAKSRKPILSNPYVAATAGTIFQQLPNIATSMLMPKISGTTNLEKTGYRSLNNLAGIKPKTIESMSVNKNPSEIGAEVGSLLNKEKVVGETAGKTFGNAQNLRNSYGMKVEQALSNIKKSGGQIEIPDYEALQPIHEEMQKLIENQHDPLSPRIFNRTYSKLLEKSNNNMGNLSLSDLKSEMEKVGEAMDNAGEGTPKEAALSSLYGILKQTHESMVQKIADATGNSNLSKDLIDANKGYTFYSRIMPDLKKASAQEGVKPLANLSTPLKSFGKSLNPLATKAAIKMGQSGNATLAGKGMVLSEDMAQRVLDAVGNSKETARKVLKALGIQWEGMKNE